MKTGTKLALAFALLFALGGLATSVSAEEAKAPEQKSCCKDGKACAACAKLAAEGQKAAKDGDACATCAAKDADGSACTEADQDCTKGDCPACEAKTAEAPKAEKAGGDK